MNADDWRGKAVVGLVIVLAIFATLESYKVSRTLAVQSPDTYGVRAAAARFAPLLDKLPREAVVAYMTDLEDGAQEHGTFLAVQYAVAPRLLVRAGKGPQRDWAIGNFYRAADFAIAGSKLGYELIEDAGQGVVLYRRKAKP